ncbi:hypothetical protein ACT0BH_001298 [Enterobacter hormaechei]
MEFTKEQLRECAREKVKGLEYALKHPGAFADSRAELEEELELARIALASLEAEPVSAARKLAKLFRKITNSEIDTEGNAHVVLSPAETLMINEARIALTAPPAPVSVPETLPCPVLLEPGMRFGKGVRTQTMLDALQRRAKYYAELEVMTPEQRAEHDAGIREFAAMLKGGNNAD